MGNAQDMQIILSLGGPEEKRTIKAIGVKKIPPPTQTSTERQKRTAGGLSHRQVSLKNAKRDYSKRKYAHLGSKTSLSGKKQEKEKRGAREAHHGGAVANSSP